MSAIHPGSLHGTGSRTNKTRYHYARQRVQDSHKGKANESTDSKKDEAESKSSSHSLIVIVLVVLICVTWGVAVTAYLGIIDYKGLIARSSNISAADATDYASYLYPFQYEFFRHPLKSLGSILMTIDDEITNLFTFTRAPFQIIDKRRQATVAPARRIRKTYDLSKRDAPEKPQEEPLVTSSEKETQEQVDVEQPKTPESPEEPKEAESPKPSDEQPESPKEATKQELEKPKDVSVTLNLHLIVGQDNIINESHLVSENGAILRIGTKSSSETNENHNPDVDAKTCNWVDKKQIFFSLFPLNKASIPYCNGNPPVRRLVLDGVVQNPTGYSPQNLDPVPPRSFDSETTKLTIHSSPVGTKSLDETLIAMATENLHGYHGNSGNPVHDKLVIDTQPFTSFGNSESFGGNDEKDADSDQKSCGKSCFVHLNFMDKNPLPKISQNDEYDQKNFAKISLPKVLPKNPTGNPENSNSEIFMFFERKISHPNPINKHFLLKNSDIIENSDSQQNSMSKPPTVELPSRNKKVSQFFRKASIKPKNSLPNDLKNTKTIAKHNPCKKFSKKFDSSREIVPLEQSSRCVANMRYFVERKMIFRAVGIPVFDRIIRSVRFSLGHNLRLRSMANPCSRRMIQHYTKKHDTAKLQQRKAMNSVSQKNIQNVWFLYGLKFLDRSFTPPPAPRVIQKLSPFVTSRKIRSHDLRSARRFTPPPSQRIIRSFRYCHSSQRTNSVHSGSSPLKRAIQNFSVGIDRKRLFRGTRNPLFFLKQDEPSQEFNSGEHSVILREMSNPTLNRVILNTSLSNMGQRVLNRKVMTPNLSKMTRNVKFGMGYRKISIGGTVASKTTRLYVNHRVIAPTRVVRSPTSNRVIQKFKPIHMGRRMLNRKVVNPSSRKMAQNSKIRMLNRKIIAEDNVASQVRKFMRAAVKRKKQLLLTRLPTEGDTTYQRLISMPEVTEISEKRPKIANDRPLSPKQKLKRKFSRMFDRTCDVINAFVSVIRKLNIFERTYRILPKKLKNSLAKARNVTVISKVIDVAFNTTLNDVITFVQDSGQKIWSITREKYLKFYDFLKQKSWFRSFTTKMSKFCNKMKQKYEKVSEIIAKNFVKFEYNQKLLTSVLVTLSIVGLYSIFHFCFDMIFPRQGR